MEQHTDSHDNNHSHDHGHDRSHDFRTVGRRRLWIALGINFAFLIVEVVGGLLSNSLALLADAGHMLADVSALILAIIVAHLVTRSPTPNRTFGLLRAEVLGGFVNGAALVVIVIMIFHQAWSRFGEMPEINGPLMLVVAVLGFIANALSAWVLFPDRHSNVNIRGAYLHLMADALGSIGAITASVVVLATGWTPIDSLMSIGIGVLILAGSWGLLSETISILLEATPADIDYEEVKKSLESVAHVSGIHDLHIWTISSGIPSLSVHLKLYPECSDTTHWQHCLKDIQEMLRERFGIVHSTIQFEPEDFVRDNRSI